MVVKIAAAEAREPAEIQARKAAISAFFGFFVDMFDVYLPVIVLAPAFIYFQPPSAPPRVVAIAASLVFAATLIGRPLGSVIFGYLSDKIGRKPITMISIAGFGVFTILMGLMPGYESWGAASLYVLILLRLLDGICLGGEYTAANVLAMEAAPKEKRGFYSGLVQGGYPAAYVAISAITFLMLLLFPATGGLQSPYVAWGWRIPFFAGGVMALVFILPFRAAINESALWEKASKKESPFAVVFSRENFPHVLQVFLLVCGFWFLVLADGGAILPATLVGVVHLAPRAMTVVIMVGSAALFVAYLVVGAISQIIGRRPMIIAMSLLSATLGLYCYHALVSSAHSYGVVMLLSAIITCTATGVWGIATVYLNERFPTRSRSSGFGMAYTLPVIIASFFAFYQSWLSNIMPYKFTPLVLLGLGALLAFIGAILGPETKDVDLALLERTSSGRLQVAADD